MRRMNSGMRLTTEPYGSRILTECYQEKRPIVDESFFLVQHNEQC